METKGILKLPESNANFGQYPYFLQILSSNSVKDLFLCFFFFLSIIFVISLLLVILFVDFLEIFDKNNIVIQEDDIVKTGDKLMITFPNNSVFITKISVLGDVTGTGYINDDDVVEGYKILRNLISKDSEYREALDITKDKIIKINDVAKLYQYTKNKIDYLY